MLGFHAFAAQRIQHRVGDGGFVFGDQDHGHAGRKHKRYASRMNYRHAFHAGNHADVLKHIVLLALLDALKKKEAPFFVLDTHAGPWPLPAGRA